jgi:hypothetical protein
VIKKVSLLLAAPSLTLTVIVAVPDRFAAGVTATVLLTPEPPRVMLEFGTSVVLDELPLSVRLPGAVSTSPTVKAMLPVEVSSFVVWSEMSEIVGASFTAFTVSWKVSVAIACPSLTVTVIVAVPD